MGQGNDHTLARYGQGLVEYALIMLLIAIAVFVAVTLFGVQLQATYLRIAASVNP
jgi:Flp pilus assembly pilin Flp